MFPKRGRNNNRKPFKRFNRGKGHGFQNTSSHNNTKEYRHQDQLLETEVGITEFISKLEGFPGIIKARFSDFQVNEIDLDGNVAKLTNTTIPKDFVTKAEKVEIKDIPNSPIEQIPQETWDSIRNLIGTTEKTEPILLEADSLEKEDRAKVHQCVKSAFGQKIVASTITKDEKKYMQFKKYDKADTSSNRGNQWPEDKPEYVHFLLYKEAMDTMDAAIQISDCLRMATSNFQYAGVKDKRAKTTQWFSVRKVEPWKLIIKTKPIRYIRIGNITFKDAPIKLGQLTGNKFRIALRNVTATNEIINESMESLKKNGFINYYGLQRFGNDKEVPTFTIGINLLLGNWKEAALAILKPKAAEDPTLPIFKAKKVYAETGDAEKALKELDRYKNRCVEYKLLLGLSKGHANDFVNALETIPRNTRLLYLHSFQSLIWNKMVSKRITEFGLEPVEGDLVLIKEEIVKDTSKENDDLDEDEIKCKQEVKALTAADKDKYTIFDIVLPLPGYDITYPENLKQFYAEILEEHGLQLEMTKQKVKTYTLCGNYRKIMSDTKNLTWKIMSYNDPTDNLIRSDLEELRGDPEPESVENGQYKALIMDFSLSSSSYATMVLREILKTDTSTSSHAKLNNYHQDVKDKKIIVNEDGEGAAEGKYCEIIQSSSLLSDQEKYKDFKNSIFNSIAEKRKTDDESCEVKKFKLNESAKKESIKE